jgi:chromosome segregation ATPase
MSDNSEFTRLAALLISRQDHQQTQMDRLVENGEKLISRQDQQQAQIDLLTDNILKLTQQTEKFGEALDIFGQVQERIIDQLELIYAEQQRFNQRQEESNQHQEDFNKRQEEFNKRQEEFNKRQDEFNIIFLEEIRGMKNDIRTLRDITLKQYDERIQRLEDFMNGFMRKAS